MCALDTALGVSLVYLGESESSLHPLSSTFCKEEELGSVSYFLSTYYVPDTKPGTLDVCAHLLLVQIEAS